LTDDEKKKPDSERGESGEVRRLEGRILLDLKEPNQSQKQPSNEPQTWFQRVLKWCKKRRILIELTAVGVAIWYAILTHSLVGLTQKQLELSERPWVSADVSIEPPLVFNQNGNGASMWVDVLLKNVGHSVARYVTVWPALKVDSVLKMEKDETELCNIPKSPTNANSTSGYLLFPNESVNDRQPVIVSPKEITEALKGQIKGRVEPFLIVCVDYKSVFEPSHHQTMRLRTIIFGEPGGVAYGAFDPLHGSYPNIAIIPQMHGDSAD